MYQTKVGVAKVKPGKGRGYPQRDQGEGPGTKMPNQVKVKKVNKRPMTPTTRGALR